MGGSRPGPQLQWRGGRVTGIPRQVSAAVAQAQCDGSDGEWRSAGCRDVTRGYTSLCVWAGAAVILSVSGGPAAPRTVHCRTLCVCSLCVLWWPVVTCVTCGDRRRQRRAPGWAAGCRSCCCCCCWLGGRWSPVSSASRRQPRPSSSKPESAASVRLVDAATAGPAGRLPPHNGGTSAGVLCSVSSGIFCFVYDVSALHYGWRAVGYCIF